ncbi:MAG: phosphoribosylanthranilate isomerase [Agathobacter sp.]|nr:phosphoribosylanthranilate isomerase [Agathobacter sp.]
MKIKICGITKEMEIGYLNQVKTDYAGFVIFEKSKRYVTVEQAKKLFEKLDRDIKKVAVTVSPSVSLAREIQEAGFDVLQVHKVLDKEVLDAVSIPVWYAFNISKKEEMEEKQQFFQSLSEEQNNKIQAIVVDGAEYGSGKTFDWSSRIESSIFEGRQFILAGGLRASNVEQGISIFQPNMVDVSSGVEGDNGKDEELIKEFVERVRTNE